MATHDTSLPCPSWHFEVRLEGEDTRDAEFAQLPASAAVFRFEDGDGRSVLIGSSGNLRRLARRRLGPVDEDSRSKTADLRGIVRRIRGCRVASAFESDWAYLQLARQFAPDSYQAMLDRWQAWFVHCDPNSPFPQWVKTAHPSREMSGSSGVIVGPVSDKHAAARYIELLQDVFDLCRYHHILIQAPHGSACAYKEMGRCPAPCDGSVSMDHYREQINDSIQFASTDFDAWRDALKERIKSLSADRRYEDAQQLTVRLERAEAGYKPAFQFVDRIEHFRFLAVMPCEGNRGGEAGGPGASPGVYPGGRLFAIKGGWIQPWLDIAPDAPASEFQAVLECVRSRMDEVEFNWSEAAMENLGMICAHLFRTSPAKKSRKRMQPGSFLRVDDRLTAATLRRAVMKATKGEAMEDEGELADRELEPLVEQAPPGGARG